MNRILVGLLAVLLALQLGIVIINFGKLTFMFTGTYGLVPLNEVVSLLFVLYVLLLLTVVLVTALIANMQR